jgi:DNA-binding XRE family transcriptional regulator
LPFCQLHIKALRCPYPTRWKCTQRASTDPNTLGEHLKRVRIERHLFQTDVAKLLAVDRVSIQNWERGLTVPAIRFIPRIIQFLGYDPASYPLSVSQPSPSQSIVEC